MASWLVAKLPGGEMTGYHSFHRLNHYPVENCCLCLYFQMKIKVIVFLYKKYISLVFIPLINFPTHWLRKTKRLTSLFHNKISPMYKYFKKLSTFEYCEMSSVQSIDTLCSARD